ncbi:hypothetical protein C8F01DRAFT_1262360 [Mycena amicta]|nr:hypothetical protein C8F01DRAFT_1262360 [Mycena amicta]
MTTKNAFEVVVEGKSKSHPYNAIPDNPRLQGRLRRLSLSVARALASCAPYHDLRFRCFKDLERRFDRVTAAAGPFFVTFAMLLTDLGSLFLQSSYRRFPLLVPQLYVPIALSMHYHYLLVTPIRPGFVDPSLPLPTELLQMLLAKDSQGGLKIARSSELGGVRLFAVQKHDEDVGLYDLSALATAEYATAPYSMSVFPFLPRHSHSFETRIHQCVGIHNERHFVLFVAYLVLACLAYCFAGWETALTDLGFGPGPVETGPTPSPPSSSCSTRSSPPGIMLLFHVRTVAAGETTVEGDGDEIWRCSLFNVAVGMFLLVVRPVDVDEIAKISEPKDIDSRWSFFL